MLLNSLPNPEISFTTERPKLRDNVLLHARSTGRYDYPRHATPHMLVANPNSLGNYTVDEHKLTLTGNSFLFLGANDELSISYGNPEVETVFIFFEDQFLLQAYRAFSADHPILLDHPFEQPPEWNRLASIPLEMTREVSSLFDAMIRLTADQRQLACLWLT